MPDRDTDTKEQRAESPVPPNTPGETTMGEGERGRTGGGVEKHIEKARETPSGPGSAEPERPEPNRGHGTPAGAMGAVNETDDGHRDAEKSEKGDDLGR